MSSTLLPLYVFDPTPLQALGVLVFLLLACFCVNNAQLQSCRTSARRGGGPPLCTSRKWAEEGALQQMEEQLAKLQTDAEKQEDKIQQAKGDLGNLDRALLFLIRVRVRSRFRKMRQQGRLRVRLNRAVGLKPGDWVGLKVGNIIRESADPFVVIEAGKGATRREHRSRIIPRTLDPMWNEDFEFYGTLGDFVSSGIKLVVYDKDIFTENDFLGTPRLARQVPLGQAHRHRVPRAARHRRHHLL